MQNTIFKYAFLNAVGTAGYIGLIAFFFFTMERLFGNTPDPKTMLIPMGMLMLFVFSAAVTSGLVLGRPILWYLDGKKKDAVTLFLYTLGILFAIMLVVFLTLWVRYGA